MSALLQLCGPDDLDQLDRLVAAYHASEGIALGDADRRATLETLLGGIPHGAAYLVGPRRAPVGYLTVSFGFSIEFGGIDSFVDEFYIRPNVRGRGMGSEALARLLPALAEHGVRAVHLTVAANNERARRLYARAGFAMHEGLQLMTCRLGRLS